MLGRTQGKRERCWPTRKVKVDLGLCLTKLPKHGDLCYDVLTETGGTHVVTARGVATEHVLGQKATPAPSVTSPYIKKMDWCKGERSEGQSRGTHPATTTQPAGKAHPKHPVLLHIAGTPNQDCFQGCQNTKHPRVSS